METSEFFSTLGELVKPGSAILGLMIVIQSLHKVIDSSRVYKIKQLELLYSCMRDADSIGSAYTIEKLLERTYKIHIPYEQAMIMMAHPERHRLFSLYKASFTYLEFSNKQFSLRSKYQSKKAVWVERVKCNFLSAFKYYFSALFGGVLLVIAFNLFYLPGLFEVQYGTFNIIWFLICIVVAVLMLAIAIGSLVDPTSITKAKLFQEYFETSNSQRKVSWVY
ncbi:hypothetical protein OPW39_08195 [Vibrio europaeus]|uniref:hypothetical protein n=1 Tax=Vibrio europaeus TaxID=300876 RepID=UPI00233EAFFC|nr:hypothetical protein [Vibrio europaeus]MDC5868806.1 hypothetical protein [Vibrio europaeus]